MDFTLGDFAAITECAGVPLAAFQKQYGFDLDASTPLIVTQEGLVYLPNKSAGNPIFNSDGTVWDRQPERFELTGKTPWVTEAVRKLVRGEKE